jgi:uncharacterized protein (TIGR00369 family)
MTHVEARRTMSGLEFFRRMLAGEMPPPPMIELLGIRLAEVEEGRVVFTATCEERFDNGTGVAHGGFAATLLDTALGCAINSAMPAGRRFTTLELKVNLTRPITKDAGLLRWEARGVHVGGRTATSEGRIVDRSGKLYAHDLHHRRRPPRSVGTVTFQKADFRFQNLTSEIRNQKSL